MIWLKDASCADLAGTDIYGRADWETAKAAAAALSNGTCGLTNGSEAGDWSLPTAAEWKAFMSTVYDHPALVNTMGDAKWSEGDAFTGVQFYNTWSSTEYDSSDAWYASMISGNMRRGGKGYLRYVWPVRSDN